MFLFIYARTSFDTNRNFESCLSIRCLVPRFFHFRRGFFSFAFGNFASYCVVLLNAPLSDRDSKKKLSAIG